MDGGIFQSLVQQMSTENLTGKTPYLESEVGLKLSIFPGNDVIKYKFPKTESPAAIRRSGRMLKHKVPGPCHSGNVAEGVLLPSLGLGICHWIQAGRCGTKKEPICVLN